MRIGAIKAAKCAFIGMVFCSYPIAANADEAEDTAVRLLQVAERNMINQSFRMVGDRETGRLNEGESESITISLKAGVEYGFVATCDNDCNDLDLELTDDDGYVMTEDVDVDDNPLISFTPRFDGNYDLQIAMADCRIEPCAYGASMFVRAKDGFTGKGNESGKGKQQASSSSSSEVDALAALLGLGVLLFSEDNKSRTKSNNYKK
jgi:hypothetical protein